MSRVASVDTHHLICSALQFRLPTCRLRVRLLLSRLLGPKHAPLVPRRTFLQPNHRIRVQTLDKSVFVTLTSPLVRTVFVF